MVHKIMEAYFLTSTEYAILLAGAGMKQIYTVQAENRKIDESQICLAMNHLYQTGLVDSKEEKFVIREGLEEMIAGICQADEVLFLRSGRDEEKAVCCFKIEEGFVAAQLSDLEEDSYKIYEMTDIEFIQRALEELFVLQNYEAVLEEEKMYQEIRTCRKSVSKEDIRKYHNLSLVAERIDAKSGAVKRRMLIRLTPEGKCMDIVEKGKTIVENAVCEEKNVEKFLKWFMEGETE